MAVPNFTSYLQQVQQLASVSQQLLLLAEQERWDDLLLAWPSYEKASAQLPSIVWDALEPAQSSMMQENLLQLQSTHEALLAAALAWRSQLQDILQNTVQSRKLNNMYR
jgi:hypothetical protein